MEAALDALVRIAQVLIGVGLVIFVHELGHFLAAKWVGIRVERFSLGFPPRLVGFQIGETDYCISAIPLGGYVKMAGEDPSEAEAFDAGSYASKTVGQRALVISAGVIMNVIFAVVGFLVAFKVGVEMHVPVVGSTSPGSPAENKLLRGDEIVEVDGEAPLDFVDVALSAAFADGGIDVTVLRQGERKTIRIAPERQLGQEIQRLGVTPIEEVFSVEEGSAAQAAGLRRGDRLLAVQRVPKDGEAAPRVNASLVDIVEALYEGPGEPFQATIWRDGRYETIPLTPTKKPMRTFGIELSEEPVVLGVIDDAPAQTAGLEEGDLVRSINGEPARIDTIVERIKGIARSQDPAMRFVVLRGGEERTIEITPISGRTDGPVIGASFGVNEVKDVEAGSPAARAGITSGSRLLSLEGQPLRLDAEALERHASSLGEGDVAKIGWRTPSGEEKEAEIGTAEVDGKSWGYLGASFAPATQHVVAPGLIAPVRLGLERTWMFLEQVFLTIKGMFTQKIGASTLGGPITITKQAYEITERGVGTLLYFLCIISINLAVLNILPIPILDGGHLAFLIAERVKGSPVSVNVQIRAQQVGLILVLLLIVFVTRNDILRLING